MAQPLSFLFQVVSSEHAVHHALKQAFAPADISPDIVHFAWAVPLPAATAPGNWVLLSTVYDENFDDYIADLVKANPAAFTAAAQQIVGLQGITLPQDMSKFITFIRAHDLTNGGQPPGFYQDYPYSCIQIHHVLG